MDNNYQIRIKNNLEGSQTISYHWDHILFFNYSLLGLLIGIICIPLVILLFFILGSIGFPSYPFILLLFYSIPIPIIISGLLGLRYLLFTTSIVIESDLIIIQHPQFFRKKEILVPKATIKEIGFYRRNSSLDSGLYLDTNRKDDIILNGLYSKGEKIKNLKLLLKQKLLKQPAS